MNPLNILARAAQRLGATGTEEEIEEVFKSALCRAEHDWAPINPYRERCLRCGKER